MRHLIARVATEGARRAGAILVPEWRAGRLDEERHLRRLLAYLDVDCVFDVGGNIGQYGQMLREDVGYRGRIVSFEPHPDAVTKLKAAAAQDPLWEVEAFALGNDNSQMEFHAHELTELSSFRSFGDTAHKPDKDARLVMVPMRRLEDYLPEARARWGFRRPYLKIDTQGFDLEVAKGAGGSLGDFLGLQSEVAFQTIYEGAPDYRAALDFYGSKGFVLSRLVPIHDAHFPETVEMDAIMIRANEIKRAA